MDNGVLVARSRIFVSCRQVVYADGCWTVVLVVERTPAKSSLLSQHRFQQLQLCIGREQKTGNIGGGTRNCTITPSNQTDQTNIGTRKWNRGCEFKTTSAKPDGLRLVVFIGRRLSYCQLEVALSHHISLRRVLLAVYMHTPRFVSACASVLPPGLSPDPCPSQGRRYWVESCQFIYIPKSTAFQQSFDV